MCQVKTDIIIWAKERHMQKQVHQIVQIELIFCCLLSKQHCVSRMLHQQGRTHTLLLLSQGSEIRWYEEFTEQMMIDYQLCPPIPDHNPSLNRGKHSQEYKCSHHKNWFEQIVMRPADSLPLCQLQSEHCSSVLLSFVSSVPPSIMKLKEPERRHDTCIEFTVRGSPHPTLRWFYKDKVHLTYPAVSLSSTI